MRTRPVLWLLLLLTPLLVGTAPALGGTTATRQASLAARLSKVLNRARLAKDGVGVVVLTRGRRPRVVFARGAGTVLVPASVAKVLTSAAALDLLGPSYVFRTRLTARGPRPSGGTLQGDLVLHGGADPNLSGRAFKGDPMHVLRAIAAAVRKAGIRRVEGALVLDEGLLDKVYLHPEWSAADTRRWYGAPVGGLSFNDGCIDVDLRSPKRGGKTVLRLPATAGPWTVQNNVKTVPKAHAAAGGRWLKQGAVLQLHGRLPPGGRTGFHIPVKDPAGFLGGALLHALKDAGVVVTKGQRPARDDQDRLAGDVIVEHTSKLAPTLKVLNQRSQNFYAGMLFKLSGAALAGNGTWAAGGRAVGEMLRRRQIADGGKTRMRDGSGLSTKNRVAAATVAQVLSSFDGDILRGPILYESLAISGRAGTLKRRLREKSVAGRVHAKTGTLNQLRARALAGYVDGRAGHAGYVFAIILNGTGASHAKIDELVREIAR